MSNGIYDQLAVLVRRVPVDERTRVVAKKLTGLKAIRITGIQPGRSINQRFQILHKVRSEIAVLQLVDLLVDLPLDDLVECLTETVDAVRTFLTVPAAEPSLIILVAFAAATYAVTAVIANLAI